MAEHVKRTITGENKLRKILQHYLDCTPDISKTEHMTIIVCFVHVTCSDGAYGVKICEHFLGFVPVADATSSTLTNTELEFLEKMNIPLSDMRGQGYDNGANMKGKHSGL
ncbi:hypothetical protein PR048_029948 [Dryococelus australis]|uniref:DUF4371 domain-containing protein n=1 Tax=Dryococelus australis TaxID=614101 RepID=A0ABQ9G7L6_9NEOP|nr:hypothetical protein PR048_029948 [Dryococelus australis]